jgi:hypothetical protein
MPLQGPTTSSLPPPSLEMVLILCSLETINEMLKGHPLMHVEVELRKFKELIVRTCSQGHYKVTSKNQAPIVFWRFYRRMCRGVVG